MKGYSNCEECKKPVPARTKNANGGFCKDCDMRRDNGGFGDANNA